MKGTRYTDVYTRFKLFLPPFFLICLLYPVFSCAGIPPETEHEKIQLEEQLPEKTDPEAAGNNDFTVSEEKYERTFTDIEILIEKLNSLIRNSRFDEWKEYLTDEYIEYYSDLDNLKAVSETPVLKKHNIALRSLNDYFRYVVVPSRSAVRLDDISFIDDSKVVAYMIIDGVSVVLYTLVNIDGQWKIGL